VATTTTPNTVPGIFKEVYADSLVNALPNFAILQRRVNFNEMEMTGDKYVVGVKLQHEHGFTYGPSSGANTLLTLNASVAGYIGRAQIEGYQIVLRSRIDYASASKAAAKGKKAFASAYGALVENMKESFAKRLELSLLYGQRGLGQVTSNTSGALLLTATSWAPGIWSGMKDCILEAFDGVTGTDTQHNGDLTISAVDISARTVTVTGTNAAVVANDHLFFKGARTASAFNECPGLDKIMTNTGTLFNISAATYELWKANSSAVGGAISMSALLTGVNKCVAMGLMEDVQVLIAPSKWSVLNSDQAALRAYDDKYSPEKAENGFEGLLYHSTNGKIEVISHPMVKEGEAFIVPLKRVKRVGSSDIAFKQEGTDELVLHVMDVSAYEIRVFSDQGLFVEVPALCCKLTGIS
jgi:hypothetical protein